MRVSLFSSTKSCRFVCLLVQGSAHETEEIVCWSFGLCIVVEIATVQLVGLAPDVFSRNVAVLLQGMILADELEIQ